MSDAFARLAAAEREFYASEFLAPVVNGGPIRVRIAGVVMQANVTKTKKSRDFSGWGVFKPKGMDVRFVRNATMSERRKYLDLFPMLRLVICRRSGDQWFGVPARHSDKRFNIPGLAPIQLAEEVQLFDTVIVRFDGGTLWFDSIDENADLRLAVYLRDQLRELVEPAKLDKPGLTPELRDSYIMAYMPAYKADLESKRDKVEERLKSVLERAGADYKGYVERADSYTVEYTVEVPGHGRHTTTSTVAKDEATTVISAGICLSGQDHLFDLGSLVSVIAEGIRRGSIVTVGAGGRMTEDGYRRMYGDGEPRDEWDDE